MRAIRIHETGGPEVLRPEEIETPEPGVNEVLIEIEVAGVNYADLGLRMGVFHNVELPATPGFEVAGRVAALGGGVEGPAVGARVVAVLGSGGYAEYAVAPVGSVVEVPDGVDLTTASGALLVQGLTAYGVLHDAARMQEGDSVLVQAASGGVGSLAVQFARLAGASTVIGTAGSPEKRERVLGLGADHAVDYTKEDWPERVLEATGGRGADVVMESVAGEQGRKAYDCLAPLGRIVFFGGASGGEVPKPDMWSLNIKGQAVSGFGGPWLRPGAADAARRVILRYLSGDRLEVLAGPSFTLEDAAEAHRAIEERRSIGKMTLTTKESK